MEGEAENILCGNTGRMPAPLFWENKTVVWYLFAIYRFNWNLHEAKNYVVPVQFPNWRDFVLLLKFTRLS